MDTRVKPAYDTFRSVELRTTSGEVFRSRSARQRAQQIPHHLASPIDARGADLDKSERGMEGIRRRVRRADVDLTDHVLMAGPARLFKQILIKPACTAAPARRCGDHDAVHIDKARIAGAKPKEIRAVVVGA